MLRAKSFTVHRLPILYAAAGVALCLAVIPWCLTTHGQNQANSGLPVGFPPPSTPQQTLKSIVVPKGLRVELVAAEPDIVDPVAFTWDAQGRLYVVEMNDYPNSPAGGRVKLLQGVRGHGKVDRVTVFAEGLPFPDGIFPWRNGVLVTAAPNLWYLEDTDGDGRADVKKVLFTGFHEGNPQHRVNGLIWGVDNWIYACNGDSGGVIRAPDRPDRPPLEIRGRDFRFRPDTRDIEPVAGQSQYGHTFDAWGRRFFCNNRVHIRFAPIAERYLRRAPDLVFTNVINVAEYGPVGAKVFPISPSQERFNDYTHSGHFTSACSVHIYLGDLLPADYQGCAYTCEPVHNLVHRCRVEPSGSVFIARRVDQQSEFFASRDPWCRPVYVSTGPDGALYIADFYRAVVEHPQWIPVEVQKRLNLRAGEDRGRIYRIVPENYTSWQYPDLQHASNEQLLKELAHPNAWRRNTAQRLLFERGDKSIAPQLQALARSHPDPQARLWALWLLDSLHALTDELIIHALAHPEPGLRENALILAEARLSKSPSLQEKVLSLVEDQNARVRFQLALSLGELSSEKAYSALAEIARRDAEDPWTRLAILSSVAKNPLSFAEILLKDGKFLDQSQAGRTILLIQLARLIGTRQGEQQIARFLEIAPLGALRFSDELALITALLEGQARRNLLSLWKQSSPAVQKRLEELQNRAADLLKRESTATSELVACLRFLGVWAPDRLKPLAEKFLHARYPQDLQLAALQAYTQSLDEVSTQFLIRRLAELSPGVRSEALERLLRNKSAAPWMLTAMEKGELRPAELDARRRQQLLSALDPTLRSRADQILGKLTPRKEIVRQYQDILRWQAEPRRGRDLFLKHCAQCHQRDGQGVAVGPNLDDARGKSPEQLLEDILDPNAAVAPNYSTYVVETHNGQTYTGILISESETRIVLMRAEGARDEIPRERIAEIRATSLSLMPENLEQTLSKQDLADIIAYLRQP